MTTPYAHQVEALHKMQGKEAFALLMGMRTGKTKVIIDEWVADGMPDLLVVAPAGAYRTWEGEIRKHAPYSDANIGVWDSSEESRIILTRPGRPKVFLTNVEAYSTVTDMRVAAQLFLQEGSATMVVDESTTIKSMDSKRGKVIRELGKLAKKRRILSGLPTPQSPLDLYGQFEFLDHSILNFVSYTAFKQRYAVTRKMKVGGYWIDIVKRYQNVEDLWGKIETHSFRRRLEDCADVPPKSYVIRDVVLTAEQKRMYEEMKEYATTQLASGEHVTSQQVITTMLRLHQICCGRVVDEQGISHQVPSTRMQSLVDLLREYDGKAIVWFTYAADLEDAGEKIEREHGAGSVARFWGGNRATREEESRRFKEDPACRFMLATPGSGGRGRTWPEAGLLVYYSNSDNLEHRDQSEERASSVSRVDRVTVVDMMARGTVEEKIIHAMRKKIDLATTVTNDNWREWVV